MTPVVQVCIVVLTLALTALVLKSFELVKRLCALTVTAEDALRHANQNVEQSTAAWVRVQRILDAGEEFVHAGVGGARAMNGAIGHVAAIVAFRFDKVELLVRAAVALVHGVQGAIEALARRQHEGARPASPVHQGEQHV